MGSDCQARGRASEALGVQRPAALNLNSVLQTSVRSQRNRRCRSKLRRVKRGTHSLLKPHGAKTAERSLSRITPTIWLKPFSLICFVAPAAADLLRCGKFLHGESTAST